MNASRKIALLCALRVVFVALFVFMVFAAFGAAFVGGGHLVAARGFLVLLPLLTAAVVDRLLRKAT
jgi:hypothetical protein